MKNTIKYNKLAVIMLTVGLASCSTPIQKNFWGIQTNQEAPIAEEKLVSYEQKQPESHEQNAETHFALAQAYSSDGSSDKAIEEYKAVLMYDPKSALVHARIATEYIRKGMGSQAMESCKEALKINPKFDDVRLILAGIYSAANDNRAALAEYDTILKTNPKNEEAIVFKAQLMIEDHKSDEAVAVLGGYLKKNANSAAVWYYMGRAQAHRDNQKEAEIAFKKAMQINEQFIQPGLALGYMYEIKGDMDKAIKAYEELFVRTREVAAASRISTLLLKKGKYKESIPYLEVVQAADPEDLNAKVKLGLVYMEMKDYDKSIKAFKKILEKTPDSDRVHFYLGSIYEEQKNTDLAVQHLRKINQQSRFYQDAVLHSAHLLKQSDRLGEAQSVASEAVSSDPKIVNFHILSASLDEESRRIDSAITTMERAAKLFPEDEKVLYYLGSLYDKKNETEKSLKMMQAILEKNPDNVDALNYVGYTWTSQRTKLDDAEQLLKRALQLRPDNGYVQDSWGWYLFARGKVSEAVVQLEKAVKMKPDEPTILEHLGDVYVHANLLEKAIVQYQEASRLMTDDESSKKALVSKIDGLHRMIATNPKKDMILPEMEDAPRSPAQQSTVAEPSVTVQDAR
ncbi:MAG: tetratricopeptide repeat protein [Xanthomonadaceae bacterium]|nr:tetratricopeptide repeat protein [Xanthomonadaceae bacterium]